MSHKICIKIDPTFPGEGNSAKIVSGISKKNLGVSNNLCNDGPSARKSKVTTLDAIMNFVPLFNRFYALDGFS